MYTSVDWLDWPKLLALDKESTASVELHALSPLAESRVTRFENVYVSVIDNAKLYVGRLAELRPNDSATIVLHEAHDIDHPLGDSLGSLNQWYGGDTIRYLVVADLIGEGGHPLDAPFKLDGELAVPDDNKAYYVQAFDRPHPFL